MESNHDKVRYPCDKCDHVATRKRDLKRHVKSKHEGVRYPCDKCDFAAKNVHVIKIEKKSRYLLVLAHGLLESGYLFKFTFF